MQFRPHATPARILPLNVRSSGHYLLAGKTKEPREPGNFLQVFWCQRGAGSFFLARKKIRFRAGAVFYYLPGEFHRIEAGRAPLEYRWLTLDGPAAEKIPLSFGLARLQKSGRCPSALFTRLSSTIRDATGHGERRASLLAYEILLAASHTSRPLPPSPQLDPAWQAKLWLENHFHLPATNVDALARQQQIHRSTLYRLFRQQHKLSPVQYLTRLRLQKALALLKDSSLPVAEVASRSGLPDLPYFSKLIRKSTGFSPRAYRRSTQPASPAS